MMMNPQFSPPPYKQLRHHITDCLRTAILEGNYKAGEWLRQKHLAQEYSVSEMPVREALKTLAAEGLVEHVPYRGMRVVAFSPDDVADLYAHRSFLEGWAARLAAKRITPAELDKLKALQSQMKQHFVPEDLGKYRDLNRRFHLLVASASGRAYLIRTINQLWDTFPTMLWSNFAMTAVQSLPERDAVDMAEHDAIIAALENGDAAEAERLVHYHIESAGKQLVFILRKSATT